MSRFKLANHMDRNTKFFHGIAKVRKRRKRIEVLKIDGRNYKGRNRILTEEDRVWLERKTSKEEIRAAVWDCEPSKAHGADGYNFKFVRKMLEVIAATQALPYLFSRFFIIFKKF
ncbi:hypothetical protein PIB30_047215 [Stylosanthes scabra]|uniref:Uncharacterized protein n=1 Tax=Stylosanthes scabra TaxID=79078 RepID=A0ABU6UG14_9FABA|nr:hypothetical protein [Stylosanthes scabra]